MNALQTIRLKTLRDLWRNRSRTLMVVLSVAVGVLGVGMIVVTWDILTTDLGRRYAAINPAHVEISVPAGVSEDDLRGLETAPGVVQVQGRAVFSTRYRADGPEGTWQTIDLIAFPDPTAQVINILAPDEGAWPPGREEMVVERASLSEMAAAAGVSVNGACGASVVVDAGGRERSLTIAGTVHQQDAVTAAVRGSPVAVVSLDTLVKLRGHDRMNTIYLIVDDLEQRAEVAAAARERLERAGYDVGQVTLRDPAVHPAQDVLDVLLLVMGILGVLALALSGFLVTNTISALITQQIDQIGVMKAIGADTGLVLRAYSLTVLAYGVLGTLVAMPLAGRTGYGLARYLAGQLNIDLYPDRASPLAVAVMLGVGIAVPFIAAAGPLWRGAHITVREAIADYGLGGGSGDNRLVQGLDRVQGLPRVWALAVRNAVRVPSRLALTLLTLALGGATFIAVLSTDSSFGRTIDNLLEGQYGMDVLLAFRTEQRPSQVLPIVTSHGEVVRAEAWYFDTAVMRLASGQEVQVTMFAGPHDTQFYQPTLSAGRWLQPGEGQARQPAAVVVNRKWADEEGVQLDDPVTLDLGDGAPVSEWVVVGFNQDLVRQQTGVFVSLESLDHVLKRTDRTVTLEVRYAEHDLASQRRITAEVIDLLEQNGVEVFSTLMMSDIRGQVVSLYRILIIFLMVMSVLMALIGGLGLMGMMSINVLERSKEIGVMRAIGADSRAIVQIFWGESMVIAAISFILTLALSLPLSRAMTRAVGMAFIDTPLSFTYAAPGIACWLVLVLLIGSLASIAPALNAANLSVRESLSYE
ncbi:MAG: hypothetical protein AUK03_06485 [Anaerolineae bacterium CG2_30_64_16]|nr:MAG: hypothetical protein AUK03_06485 [Anaerolineae bacterium CG2_30_64_16]